MIVLRLCAGSFVLQCRRIMFLGIWDLWLHGDLAEQAVRRDRILTLAVVHTCDGSRRSALPEKELSHCFVVIGITKIQTAVERDRHTTMWYPEHAAE